MKKNRREQPKTHVMETYIKIVESEVVQFSKEHGLLLSENLSLREENSILREMVMILFEFTMNAKSFDGEAFKQYILTIENERLKKLVERITSEGGNFLGKGLTLLKRPKQSENPYNKNKPIIFEN